MPLTTKNKKQNTLTFHNHKFIAYIWDQFPGRRSLNKNAPDSPYLFFKKVLVLNKRFVLTVYSLQNDGITIFYRRTETIEVNLINHPSSTVRICFDVNIHHPKIIDEEER